MTIKRVSGTESAVVFVSFHDTWVNVLLILANIGADGAVGDTARKNAHSDTAISRHA